MQKKFFKKSYGIVIFFLLIVIGCIFKQILIYKLPILSYAGAIEDDELFVYHAKTLSENNWFGDYTYNTLIKNPAFSFYLLFLYKMKISYTNATTLLYSVACIFFVLAISSKVKKKSLLLLIFYLLLFNPITYSFEAFQRVYRNSVIPAFSLLVIAGYFGIYLNENKKYKVFLFSLIATIFFPFFYYTREDSIWLLPLILFVILSSIIKLIRSHDYSIPYKFYVSVLLFIPFLSTYLFGNWIALKNNKVYGSKIITTSKNTYYSKCIQLIESVKPKEKIRFYNNPREKIDRIAEVSPTFNSIKPYIDKSIDLWQSKDTHEVINGLFSWMIISGVRSAGYDTLEKENEFYEKFYNELKYAIDNNQIETQALMPIMGGRMLDKNEMIEYASNIYRGFIFVANYNKVKTMFAVISPYYARSKQSSRIL